MFNLCSVSISFCLSITFDASLVHSLNADLNVLKGSVLNAVTLLIVGMALKAPFCPSLFATDVVKSIRQSCASLKACVGNNLTPP